MRRFRRTTLLTVACLCVLIGIGLARKISFDPQPYLLLTWPLLLLLKRGSFGALIIAILAGLGLGLWQGTNYMDRLNHIKALNGQLVAIQTTAATDAIYGDASQLEFIGKDVQLLQGRSLQKELSGNFKIGGFGEPMIFRGDRVQVSGKLYPMRGSNQARIAYAQLDRLGEDTGLINNATRHFSAGMQTALPEPQASFGMGLLIGQRANLPDEVTNQLIMVGLIHIVAVSGYNLTILVRAVSRLKLGSKYQRLLASLVLIGTFVLITGFHASIVRAAIISVLGLWAWYFGRQFKPVLLIALAAAITGLANPFYVWGDLGWYLSFLAFFGVLVLAPLIAQKLYASRHPKILMMVVIETLAAEIMTLPLIMAVFNQLSIIGLLANALVIPLIPFAMLFGAIAGAAGALIPAIAGWLAWPAYMLLTYILDLAQFFSSIPNVFHRLSINTVGMLAMYICILVLLLAVHKHRRTLKNVTPAPKLDVP